jgi:type IV pilus assembly protein PilQ
MICSIRKGGRAGQSILFLLALLALPGLLACGTSMQASKPESKAVPAAAKAAASPAVTSLEAKEIDDSIRVSLATDKPVEFNVFRLQDPVRLVVDVRGAGAGEFAGERKVALAPVQSIRSVAAVGDGSAGPLSRFEILLDPLTTYQIVTSETSLVIDFAKPGVAGAKAVTARAVPAGAAKAAASTSSSAPNPTVSSVKVDREGEGYLITLAGDGALDFQTVMPDATTLIIDVIGAENQVWPAQIDPGVALIKSIRVAQVLQPEKKVRVISELTSPVTYEVSSTGSQIYVHLGTGKAMAAAGAVEGPTLRDLYFKPEEGIWKIVLSGDRELKADVIPSDDPLIFMLGFEGATVSPDAPQELDLSPLNDVVRNITLESMDEPVRMARLTMRLARAVPYQVLQSGQQIYINITREPTVAPASRRVFEIKGMTSSVVAVKPGEATASTDEEDINSLYIEKKKTYTGDPITLDLKDADIREVLRIISEISGINFVSGSDVAGSVTIRLKDVPWDQALDIILKANEPPLTKQVEAENIWRIATATKIDKESKEKQAKIDGFIKEREQKKMLEPLLTRSFRISYAKASDLAAKMNEFKSKDPNAFVKVDERTNIMIVRDRAKNLEDIQAIVDTLDQPEPAVRIEARIVEVKDTAGEEIGIQWGANKFNDAAHGNAMNYTFPNSMALGGGITGGTGASGNPLAVSLPITNASAGGALSLALGSIADTFSLDIKLQAMETLNKVKIISNPSILIVQNQKARIHVGEQIPYTETDKEGNTIIKWKDVGVTLEVTPQITAEGSVFLDLLVKKDSRGDSVITGGKEDIAIDAKEAETKVLLRDGETGVIGGLYTTETTKKSAGVPGLSKIPFIGALFRSRNDTESRNELLIFLTPKIIKNTRGGSGASLN